MRYENIYSFFSSLIYSVSIYILGYLYSPNILGYTGAVLILFFIIFFIQSKKIYMQNKQNKMKFLLEDIIFSGIFLIYNLIIFLISKEYYRENFILLTVPFLIVLIGFELYLRKRDRGETQP